MFFYVSCDLWGQEYIGFVRGMADVDEDPTEVVVYVERVINVIPCVIGIFGIHVAVLVLRQQNIVLIAAQLNHIAIYNQSHPM